MAYELTCDFIFLFCFLIDNNLNPSLYFQLLSIREIEIIVCLIVIKSHTETAKGITEESRKPEVSNILSIPGLLHKSVEDILLKSSIHVMEIEVLVGACTSMLYKTLIYS